MKWLISMHTKLFIISEASSPQLRSVQSSSVMGFFRTQYTYYFKLMAKTKSYKLPNLTMKILNKQKYLRFGMRGAKKGNKKDKKPTKKCNLFESESFNMDGWMDGCVRLKLLMKMYLHNIFSVFLFM